MRTAISLFCPAGAEDPIVHCRFASTRCTLFSRLRVQKWNPRMSLRF